MNAATTPTSTAGATARLRYWAERGYPFCAGAIVALITYTRTWSEHEYGSLVTNVLPNAVSAASILAGFQATAQAVMLAILDSKTIRFLKTTGHYHGLVDYLWRALLWLLIFTGCALYFQAAHASDTKHEPKLALAILFGLFTVAALGSYRIGKLMFRILRIEMTGNGRPPTCSAPETEK